MFDFSFDERYMKQFDELVRPYMSIYKPIIHDCTSHIILAKTVEKKKESRESSLKEIHNTIARELNLLRQ